MYFLAGATERDNVRLVQFRAPIFDPPKSYLSLSHPYLSPSPLDPPHAHTLFSLSL